MQVHAQPIEVARLLAHKMHQQLALSPSKSNSFIHSFIHLLIIY